MFLFTITINDLSISHKSSNFAAENVKKGTKMKILFVIDTLYTSNNGTSISAQRYATELRKRGHEVRALCGDAPKSESDKQITDGDFCTGIFHFPIFQPLCEKNDFYYGDANKAIIKQACDWADIVHVYTPLFMSNAAITYCKKIGKPVTAAFHIQPENITSQFGLGKVALFNKLIYRIFRKVTYNRVRHIHAPSAFIANELFKNGYQAKTHIISNGIHDEFIAAGKQKCQRPTANSQQPYKIMMIGRLSQEKRQDVIIKAMQYSTYANQIQLVFAGRGPELSRYLRLSKNLKNPPRFIYKQRPELIQELLTTDLYIHASDMEIEAISCIEAFATGLVPVIANSDKSATPQFALDDRSLFKAGDPKDLARAIDYWLGRPKERLLMEKRYAAEANKYSLANSIKLFEQMLREEIADNKKKDNETSPVTPHITVLSTIKRQAGRLNRTRTA